LLAGRGDWDLVHLNRAYAPTTGNGAVRQTGEPTTDQHGLLNFDLNTSAPYKALMAQHVKAMLHDGLLHWHQNMVSSATVDQEVRSNLIRNEAADRSNLARLRDSLGVRPSSFPMTDTLGLVLDEYDRMRMRDMFIGQVKNVAYHTDRYTNPRTLQQRITKTITGKIKPGDKDDMYMALTIGLMGMMHAYGANHVHL
jgi:hypothetical protein